MNTTRYHSESFHKLNKSRNITTKQSNKSLAYREHTFDSLRLIAVLGVSDAFPVNYLRM